MQPIHHCSQDLIKSLRPISLPNIETHDCGICLETYQMTSHNPDNDEDVPTEHPVQLPCSHIVGSVCISRWLESHNTCPFCRAKLYELKSPPTSPDSVFQEAAAADFFRSDNIRMGEVELSGDFLQILDDYDVDDMDSESSTILHVEDVYGGGSISPEPTTTLYIQTSTYYQPSSQPQQQLNFSYGSYHRGCGNTSPTVEISKCQASLELEEAVSCAAKQMDDLIDMHEEWMDEYNNNERPGMCDAGSYDDDEWMEDYKHEFGHVDAGHWLLC
ncbi:hypothetical protein BU24DRAFT_406051 [Aaosphaeria arxii CBS 175.79]|uniref:RING-type domain-containing protein n=1 Tax=Aaosphaeria arxii CBS 175.79 TaxID=1450172 RepID=A0A6A5Y2W3_9PLEO|nr:uncharacterized protein BU24DRAFT_406051 [Aaosphaeria arxii CBS 175.79]KAF2019377.1 hypothetical protein BU24DRAFT_406051 [Aaosphaeria arxii CBS 175.79]